MKNRKAERLIVRLKEVDSTNKEAFRLLENNDFVVVSALRQNAGYGRDGNTWVSSEGNIFVSAGKTVPVSVLKNLSLRACYFLFNLLNPYVNGELTIKWPNDIYLNEKKIAGILTETKIKGNIAKAVVGIGVNYYPVSVEGSGCLYNCISLSRKEVELKIVDSIDSVFSEKPKKEEILEILDRNSFLKKGERVTFFSSQEKFNGNFTGYSEDFGIKVLVGGKEHIFFSGEVKKLRKN